MYNGGAAHMLHLTIRLKQFVHVLTIMDKWNAVKGEWNFYTEEGFSTNWSFEGQSVPPKWCGHQHPILVQGEKNATDLLPMLAKSVEAKQATASQPTPVQPYIAKAKNFGVPLGPPTPLHPAGRSFQAKYRCRRLRQWCPRQ